MAYKIISSILIVTITLTTCGWFLFMPRKAQAIWGLGDINLINIDRIVEDLMDALWENIIAAIRTELKRLIIQKIQSWILGEITGEELFIVDWEGFLRNTIDIAGGRFLNDFFETNLCEWTNPRISAVILAGVTGVGAGPPECTLSQIIDNIEDALDIKRGGGWDVFLTTLEAQNNDLGIFITAQGGTLAKMAAKLHEQTAKAIAGRGYKSQKKCEEWECHSYAATPPYRIIRPGRCTEAELAAGSTDECIREKIVLPSTNIAETAEFAETIDLELITKSKTLQEILAAFISALTTRLMREVSSAIR